MRKVKILATLGPASETGPVIRDLLSAGVNAVRLNFSHGDHAGHEAVYRAVRETADELGVPCAVVADLQGPKIRVGKLDSPAVLDRGDRVAIGAEQPDTDTETLFLPCTYAGIARDVHRGERILIDDGRIELAAECIEKNRIICRVIEGGIVSEHKGINLPGVDVSVSSITEKDVKDLEFSLKLGVDYIAVSFVRTGAGLRRVKDLIKERGADVPVIAKIEKPEALDNIDAIIDESFGIMVARGDLAVETSPEEVPIVQKMLIKQTNSRCRLDIVATQMLESMIQHPTPTRAESADVANAVLDGADVVMLSGETAVGSYPVRTVRMMDRIIRFAGQSLYFEKHRYTPDDDDDSILNGITHAAALAADETRAAVLAVYSLWGDGVFMISKKRPETDIIAFTPDERLYNRFSLYYGVHPFLCKKIEGWEEIAAYIKKELVDRHILAEGNTIVCLVNDEHNNHVLRITGV